MQPFCNNYVSGVVVKVKMVHYLEDEALSANLQLLLVRNLHCKIWDTRSNIELLYST